MKGKLVMEPPDGPAAVVAGIVIAHLQQSIRTWTDADRVLPADGSSLLAILDRLNTEGTGATEVGIETPI